MADYIDKEKLLKSIPSVKNDRTISLFGAVADMICIVNSVPKEDVAPVVHAKWKNHHCTECQCQAVTFSGPNGKTIFVETPFCPNCGAKIDAYRRGAEHE